MMTERPTYYFDNNATTRVAPEVVEAMLPFLRDFWGNPSSAYRFGSQVAKHVEAAREKVAALVGAEPKEVVFTSCGTESNNAALQSALPHPAGQTPPADHGGRTLGHHQTRPVPAHAGLRSDLPAR